jgi:hypothetical protein
MPIIIIITVLRCVPKTDHVSARPNVDEYVPVDQFGEYKVIVLAAVVEEQTGCVLGLEPEVHFHS